MNVGRNYNDPKVLVLFHKGIRRTRIVIDDKQNKLRESYLSMW